MLARKASGGRFWLPLLLAGGLMAAGAVTPPALVGQEGGEGDPQPVEVEDPIEWNFQSVPVAEPEAAVSLQERWDAPFAVVSSGRPPPREARRVVVPPAAEVARRTAAVAADSGETVAEVTVAGEVDGEVLAAAEDADGGTAGGEADADEESDADADEDEAGEEAEAEETDVAAEEDAASKAEAPPAPRRHTVVRGDTLFGIARRYGVSAESIRAANRLPNDIVRLGQTLLIPREEASR